MSKGNGPRSLWVRHTMTSRRQPSFAQTPEYDPIGETDRMDDEDDEDRADKPRDEADDGARGDGDGAPGALMWPCMDWLLLIFALAMLGLFILVAPRVALGIGVGVVCVSVCAFALVSAESNEGLPRTLSLLVCALSVVVFLVWSFKYVFYMPELRTTSGCGGAYYEHMDNDLTTYVPRDEL